MRDADGRLSRLPALDGIRALAILLVIAGHFADFGGLGVAGVSLFFVLSGFLITRLLVAELEHSGQLRFGRFYWRRACRITPAYLLWVGVTWLILGHLSNAEDRSSLLGLLTYTYNYTSPAAYGFNSIIHPAWSLAVEEQFYLLWPLALTLLSIRRARGALLVLFGIVVAWRFAASVVLRLPQTYLDWAFETNAGTLALGCWLALHTMRGGSLRWTRFARPRWLTITVGVAVCAVALGLQEFAGAAVWAVPLTAIVMFLLVSLALESTPRSILTHPALRWIGAISYPLYLWHLWGLAIGERLPLPHWLQLVAAAAVSVILASASYYLLERPILRWRDSRNRQSAGSSSLEPATP
jgi:peptidoglycan/LPS O-acetylase OafA/YrhL